MKKLAAGLLLVLIQGHVCFEFTRGSDPSGEELSYLNQSPPGAVPEVFAQGIISREGSSEDGLLAWDSGRHLLVIGFSSEPMETCLQDGKWKPLEKSEIFNGKNPMQVNVSPDGSRFAFNVPKRNPDKTGGFDMEIWVLQKEADGWRNPVYSGVNGMFPYLDRQNNLYYSNYINGVQCLAVSRYRNGVYQEEEVFPGPLNSEKELVHPCVAPDGSWIIANSEHEELKRRGKDVFISFRNPDGGWSEPRNLGEEFRGGLKRVSADGKYIFFSRDGDILWASVEKILEKYDK